MNIQDYRGNMTNTVDWRTAQHPFSKWVEKASRKHAEEVFPQESVGIVVDGKYIRVDNTHEDPENHFKIHPDVLIKYEGQIQAVIHSHNIDVHPAHPSKKDQETQMDWNIPFGIQLVNKSGAGNIIWFGDVLPMTELEGRPYIFGVYDCFTIWRDYYKLELGIDLPNVAREEDFWQKGDNLYIDNAERFGFYQVDDNDLQVNDIVLIRIRSRVIPNHGIIYLGGEVGLHHMPYKTSSKDNISKFIRPDKQMFHSVWRRKA